MGEPITGTGDGRRRPKFPSLASSLYRHVGSRIGGDGRRENEYRQSWKEKLSKWKLGKSISQGSLRLPRRIFGRSRRKAPPSRPREPDELNYSTDTDDGGFKICRPRASPRKQNGVRSGADVEFEPKQWRSDACRTNCLNGKERPRSIASLPVRSEELIVCYDDCFSKSDSSLLSENYLFRTYSGYDAGSRKSSSGLYRHHSAYRGTSARPHEARKSAIRQIDQCLSVDSLPAACSAFANSSTTLSSQAKVEKAHLSASYPGYSYCWRGANPKSSASEGANARPSAVAYHPQVVSTPVVSNCRQLSINPSRRPKDFPTALVREDLNGGKENFVRPSRMSSPLVDAFWWSYDALNDRGRGTSSRNSKNRLSLPIFSRNLKNRRCSPRSSSLSSVHNLLTPSTLPTKAASLALQQLLNCYRSGDMTEEKISLLLDILDTQERFAKVRLYFRIGNGRVVYQFWKD